jgi:hypothetical protein
VCSSLLASSSAASASRVSCRRPGLELQRRRDAFAAAGQLQVTLVGEHDGLGSAVSTDDDRFGVGSVLAEAFEHRRERGACLASREDVVRLARRAQPRSTMVYT